jgi:hypothetical protein
MNKHVQIVQTVQALRSVQTVFGKDCGPAGKKHELEPLSFSDGLNAAKRLNGTK